MTHKKLSFALTSLISLSCSLSVADNHLEEITVTGSRLEESIPLTLERYGNQVEVVTAEDILKHNFVDVTDALKNLVPGLHISPKHGPFDYFSASLQGARSQDILWLVDGVRITNRLYAGTSPLDTIPSHMVERVEVLKGGQGIFYGTQSVSGAINIVTKQFSEKTDGAIGAGINSNEGYNLNAFARGGNDAHKFVVFASKDYAEGYTPYDDDDIQPSATDTERGYDVINGGVKYAWDINHGTRLSLSYMETKADLDFARPNLNRKTINAREENIATIKLDSRLNESMQLYVKAYEHTWDTSYTRIYNELDNNGQLTGNAVIRNLGTYWGYKDRGINAMVEIDNVGNLEYVVGFDHQKYSAEDDVWRVADMEETVDAVFVQVRSSEQLFDNTMIALGVRNNRPSKSDSSTVWNITGKHDFNNHWYVQANIGTSFRLPTAEDLFLNEIYDANNDGVPDGGYFAIGNPELEAEESKNINISVGANFQRTQVELTLFKRDITNYIKSSVPVTIANVVGETFANSDDEVNVEGSELQLQWQFTDNLDGRLAYTYTRARMNDSGKQLRNIPEQTAQLGINYQQIGSPWGVNFTANYVSDVEDRAVRESYTTADISGFYFIGHQQQHKLVLRIENIGDVKYATGIGSTSEDASGESYLYRSLGMERTAHLAYTFTF